MPTLPRYDESTVNPIGISPPRRATSSAVTGAMEAISDSVQGVAKQVKDYALDQQFKADTAAVQGALAQHTDARVNLFNGPLVVNKETGKAESGYLNTQAEQAIGTGASALEAYDKMTGSVRDSLKTDAQKRLFDQHTFRERGQVHLDMERHEFQQGQVVQDKNSDAFVASKLQLASTQFMDMGAGGAFEKTLEDARAVKYQRMINKGFSHDSAFTKEAVDEVTSKAYVGAIELLAKNNPLLAKQRLDENINKIGYAKAAHLEGELKPKLDAYMVDDVLARASATMKSDDPNAPMDEEKWYSAVEAETKDPAVRKLAYAEIQHKKKLHDQSTKEKFDYNYGQLSDAWEVNNKLSVKDIMAMPAFGKLDTKQQGEALGKIRAKIAQRDNTERALRASERSASAAERAARNAERAETNRKYEANYWRLRSDPTVLSNMTDDQFKATRLDVDDHHYTELQEERKKLKDPKHLRETSEHHEAVTATLSAVPGLTDQDKDKYTVKVLRALAEKQEIKGGRLTRDEVESTTIEEMQYEWVKEKGKVYGTNTVAKRKIDAGKSAVTTTRPPEMQSSLDAVAKKRGKAKLSPDEESALEQAIIERDTKDKK